MGPPGPALFVMLLLLAVLLCGMVVLERLWTWRQLRACQDLGFPLAPAEGVEGVEEWILDPDARLVSTKAERILAGRR